MVSNKPGYQARFQAGATLAPVDIQCWETQRGRMEPRFEFPHWNNQLLKIYEWVFYHFVAHGYAVQPQAVCLWYMYVVRI